MIEMERASLGDLAALLSRASVEVSSHGRQLAELSDHFSPGIDVTVTFLPGDDYRRNVETAAALRRLGFNPVLHIAAREIRSHEALDDFLARARGEADAAEADVAEAAEDRAGAVEGERVADQGPEDHRDGDRADAHHEGVERVLRPHQAGVEEAERRGHHQHQRRRHQHPGGVARADPGDCGRHREAHLSTGVRAPVSVSPVRIRTACSSGTGPWARRLASVSPSSMGMTRN